MKLKDYITQEIERGKRDFDIGVEPDLTVNEKSGNRVGFKVENAIDYN